ncbi:MAG: hypothetical protein ACRCU5_11290, partial [Rhizobiaceae bacterium]
QLWEGMLWCRPRFGFWAVTAGEITGPDGTVLPVVVARGSVDNPNASNVVFEYRPALSPIGVMPSLPSIGDIAVDASGHEFVFEEAGWRRRWIMEATQDAGATVQEFGVITPNSNYDIAVSYVVRGVLGDRLVIPAGRSGSLVASDTALVAGTPAPEIVSDISSNARTLIVESAESALASMRSRAVGFYGSRSISAMAEVFTEASINPLTGQVMSKAGFVVDANGVVGGLWLTNNGQLVDLKLVLDRMAILRPGANLVAPAPEDLLFSLDGSLIRMRDVVVDSIEAQVIKGAHLDTGALGQAARYFSESGVVINSQSTWDTLGAVTLTPKFGKPVSISYTTVATGSSEVQIRLKRDDGTYIWGGAAGRGVVVRGGDLVNISTFDGSVEERETTWTVQCKKTANNDAVTFSENSMMVEELSRVNFQYFQVAATAGSGPAAGVPGGSSYDPNKFYDPDNLN